MSSLRRMLANRANGALSCGPLTPQGKERSAQNALRHGLLAKCVALESECPETFAASLSDHLDHLRPATGLELAMVEEMVVSHWRLRRAWAIETRLLDKLTAAQPPGGDLDRMAGAVLWSRQWPRPCPHPPLRSPPPPHVSARPPQPPPPPHRRRAKRTQSHFRTLGTMKGPFYNCPARRSEYKRRNCRRESFRAEVPSRGLGAR